MPQGPRQHPLTPGSLQCCPSQTVPQACTSLIKMPKYDKARSAWLPPLTVCSWPQGRSYEGRWMRHHTLRPTICYRALLAQGLAHPGRTGGFPRARASPNGAQQQSCDSTDTQPPVTMGPSPRALNGSWAAALVSSPKTTSHPMAGVPAWPHLQPSASSTITAQILPTVTFPWPASLHHGQRGKPTPFALGRGTWGFCWHCRDHPRAALVANTLVLSTGAETHTCLHPHGYKDKRGASAPAP